MSGLRLSLIMSHLTLFLGNPVSLPSSSDPHPEIPHGIKKPKENELIH